MLRMLFGFSTPVSRRTYAATGLTLAALKYGVDASLIYVVTGRWWSPVEFLVPLHRSTLAMPLNPSWLFWALAIWTLPFVWIGASMTLRRAYDAGWSPWLGLGFFIPILNYLLMLTLCVAPSKERVLQTTGNTKPLVDNRFRAAFVGVASGVLFALAMLGLQVYLLHSYGAALFFGTPVVMGALSGYVQNRGHPQSWRATTQVAAIAVILSMGGMLLFALEGAVCILMALPIVFVATLFGASMGRAIAMRMAAPPSHVALMLLGLPLVSGVEAWPGHPVEFEAVSSIEVNAPPDQVWPNVIGFASLPEPSEWLFKTGIAYPIRARIDGAGVGAIRHCEFTTGPFVEPITKWEPPTRLSFDVSSQPIPMEEWSPYRRIHPPHLDGYFRSVRGEFRLVPMPGKRTRLEGSTWYVLEIAPVPYWRLGAEAILHAIHQRVLAHVKALAEKEL